MAVGIPLPAALPQHPNFEGLQSSVQPNVVVFPPEVGPPKTRRRGTARTKPASCAFIYSQEQIGVFEAFFEGGLKDGNLRMAWTDPIRGDLADWKFDTDNPYSITPYGTTDGWVMTWRLTRLP